MRKLIQFSFDRFNPVILTLWYGSDMLYVSKKQFPELYDAVLAIAKDNSDGIRLLYLRVIDDYIKDMCDHNNDERYTNRINMLRLFNDFNHRIKIRKIGHKTLRRNK